MLRMPSVPGLRSTSRCPHPFSRFAASEFALCYAAHAQCSGIAEHFALSSSLQSLRDLACVCSLLHPSGFDLDCAAKIFSVTFGIPYVQLGQNPLY